MKKSELTAMTVAELKTLARKKKVSLPAGSLKADIITRLLAQAQPKKKTAGKTAAKKRVAEKTAARKTAAKKAASPVSTVKKKAAGTAAKKKATVRKSEPKNSSQRIARTASVREWKLPPGSEEPLLAQERVAEAKYYTGPEKRAAVATSGELPQYYGEDRIMLMTRDPFVVYAYWEATLARLERERSWFGWNSKLCIRIYDITGVQFDGTNAIGYFDQEVADRAGNWYFDLGRPSHSFCAELGLLSPQGRFLALSRSNYVTMPRDGVSDVIDEEWLLADEDFWKLYGYEGFKGGISSPELQEMMRRRREHAVTSPGLVPRERPKARRK